MTDKTQEFLNKLPINSNYDYSKVKYLHSKIKVEIICKIHGSFFITPNNHLKGIGCNKCGIISRSSKRRNKNWLDSFRKIHNDIYDYSKVLYVNDKTKVEVICKEHGSFLVKPNNHLQGQKCYKCVFDVYDRKTFINKSNSIFNYLYDYTKVNYINNKTKVEIICKEPCSLQIISTFVLLFI